MIQIQEMSCCLFSDSWFLIYSKRPTNLFFLAFPCFYFRRRRAAAESVSTSEASAAGGGSKVASLFVPDWTFILCLQPAGRPARASGSRSRRPSWEEDSGLGASRPSAAPGRRRRPNAERLPLPGKRSCYVRVCVDRLSTFPPLFLISTYLSFYKPHNSILQKKLWSLEEKSRFHDQNLWFWS